MKERPILFNTAMVQAILSGRKTQTRRIIKPQPDDDGVGVQLNPPCLDWEQIYGEEWLPLYWTTEQGEDVSKASSPFGVPGDLLWVRETFVRLHEGYLQKLDPDPDSPHFFYCYKADGDPVHWEHYGESWKPSIHMPKEAARLWLRIKSVRVERVQDISLEDIKNEGVKVHVEYKGAVHWEISSDDAPVDFYSYQLLHERFSGDYDHCVYWCHWASLWVSVYGREAWEVNPWVWVVDFEVVS